MTDTQHYPDPASARKPESPTDLSAQSWKGVATRTVSEFMDDHGLTTPRR